MGDTQGSGLWETPTSSDPLRAETYLTVVMQTANLRSDGSKLSREVYLCILGYISLQAVCSSGDFDDGLNQLRFLSDMAQSDLRRCGASECEKKVCGCAKNSESLTRRDAQSLHNFPRIHSAPSSTHQHMPFRHLHTAFQPSGPTAYERLCRYRGLLDSSPRNALDIIAHSQWPSR